MIEEFFVVFEELDVRCDKLVNMHIPLAYCLSLRISVYIT